MRSRPTTDNFLPLTRGTSYYQSRPVQYVSRQPPITPQSNNEPLINDFLPPPALQSAQPKQQQRNWSKYALPIIVVILTSSLTGFALTPISTKEAAPLSAIAESPDNFPQQPPNSVGLPARLKIPKINIDAPLDHVGLTSLGEVDVPKDPANAAWYKQGPRPGEQGSAVIDGHFGWRDGIPAVFDNVHKLKRGDKLYIEDKKGLITTFVVRELQTFGKDENAPDVFVSNDRKAHLNLITCHGVWNNTQRSYSSRLVVFADKEV